MIHHHIFDYADTTQIRALCGANNTNLQNISEVLGIQVTNFGVKFVLEGDARMVKVGTQVLSTVYSDFASKGKEIPNKKLLVEIDAQVANFDKKSVTLLKGDVKARTKGQQRLIESLKFKDITFALGPAGTGKTFLTIAAALEHLHAQRIQKIVLTRPAIEAGESLGFLPGDLTMKIDPYMYPLYDALNELLGAERVEKLRQRKIIEVLPLAYMRGRTLSNCWMMLDEAQNATKEQLFMFMTRLGDNSKMAIAGDPSQVDLQAGSCLTAVAAKLGSVKGIAVNEMKIEDIVRNPLVQKIVERFNSFE